MLLNFYDYLFLSLPERERVGVREGDRLTAHKQLEQFPLPFPFNV